jgi:endonuclease/exonuclease/phosphatase family metal-dependent hydrolase
VSNHPRSGKILGHDMVITKFPIQHSVHINLACWNVLADSYAYSHCLKSTPETAVPKYIEWDYRKNRIANSITSSGADILCLQEVDHYTDFFEPLLEKLGYKSLYLQRHKRKDGCLIAYNSEKYNVDGVDEVQFDDIADFMETESSKSNVKRSNVALIAIISSKQFPAKKFISSTAHLYWNPRRPEVKSLQTQYLVSRISSFIAAEGLSDNIPVFVAGDFNSVPFSEPYQLLVNGFENSFSVKGAAGLASIGRTFYGPTTKFLCDRNLSRLCRWMRVLGIDTALIPDASCDHSSTVNDVNAPSKIYKKSKQSFDYIFGRAREEQRVILTTSKSMRERSTCPPSFLVSTRNLEAALIKVRSDILKKNKE